MGVKSGLMILVTIVLFAFHGLLAGERCPDVITAAYGGISSYSMDTLKSMYGKEIAQYVRSVSRKFSTHEAFSFHLQLLKEAPGYCSYEATEISGEKVSGIIIFDAENPVFELYGTVGSGSSYYRRTFLVSAALVSFSSLPGSLKFRDSSLDICVNYLETPIPERPIKRLIKIGEISSVKFLKPLRVFREPRQEVLTQKAVIERLMKYIKERGLPYYEDEGWEEKCIPLESTFSHVVVEMVATLDPSTGNISPLIRKVKSEGFVEIASFRSGRRQSHLDRRGRAFCTSELRKKGRMWMISYSQCDVEPEEFFWD